MASGNLAFHDYILALLSQGKWPMSLFSFLLNALWIVFGGLWMALAWVVAAVIMAITIIGLPWTRAAFNIAVYTLLPFGQTTVSRAAYPGRGILAPGPLAPLGNIFCFFFAGGGLALANFLFARGHPITIFA